MPPVPESKRPSAMTWIAVVAAVAALAFFGYRAFGSHAASIAPVSAPTAAPAPLPTVDSDTLLKAPAPVRPRGQVMVG